MKRAAQIWAAESQARRKPWPTGGSRRLKALLPPLAAALVTAVLAGPALACKGKKTLFSDDFREVDASWATDGDSITVEEGRAKIKANPDAGYRVLYGGALFDDADICVTVRMPSDVREAGSASAGLIFWAQDNSNYYVFEVAANGMVTLQRLVKGRWLSIIDWRRVDGLNVGVGAKNILRVTTSGNSIALYVNDVKLGSVKGQQPEGGGQVGLRSESEKTKRDAWKFSDLKVTDPAP
jgi:hypothetical protein